MSLSIESMLDNLDRSKSLTVKEESYAQLIALFKQDDDEKVLKFMEINLWRFLKVFFRDLDDDKLYVYICFSHYRCKKSFSCLGYFSHHDIVSSYFTSL